VKKKYFFLSFELVKLNTVGPPKNILWAPPWINPLLPPLEKNHSDAHDLDMVSNVLFVFAAAKIFVCLYAQAWCHFFCLNIAHSEIAVIHWWL